MSTRSGSCQQAHEPHRTNNSALVAALIESGERGTQPAAFADPASLLDTGHWGSRHRQFLDARAYCTYTPLRSIGDLGPDQCRGFSGRASFRDSNPSHAKVCTPSRPAMRFLISISVPSSSMCVNFQQRVIGYRSVDREAWTGMIRIARLARVSVNCYVDCDEPPRNSLKST